MSVSSQEWRRLSMRQGNQPPDVLAERVSAHLYEPLIEWLAITASENMLRRVAVAARLTLKPTAAGLSNPHQRRDVLRIGLSEAGGSASDALLDMVDSFLHELPEISRYVALDVEKLLDLGGSAWRVKPERDGLVRRVDPAIATKIERTMAAAWEVAPSATLHLAEALKHAYGRSPDPSKVFSESIKAVEAAAAPVVTPNDLQATLGKIIGEMRKSPTSWSVAIANANTNVVIGNMETIWKGQTDRHGGVGKTEPVTYLAAEATFHLAATLVQWFTAGAITKK
jgi:hypothetical protein